MPKHRKATNTDWSRYFDGYSLSSYIENTIQVEAEWGSSALVWALDIALEYWLYRGDKA